MYIKLTKIDSTPIWLNASFIVTIEPRRNNPGSVVVPIGDGLDYDVRESPEQVLALLENAPVATVVPVPTTQPKPPRKATPEGQPAPSVPAPTAASVPMPTPVVEPTAEVEAAPVKKVRKTTRKTTRTKAAAKSPAETPDELSPVAEPVSAPSVAEPTSPAAEPASTPTVAEPTSSEVPSSAVPAPTTESSFSPESRARLVRMAPSSIKKLTNTLKVQFKVDDPEALIQQLIADKLISLDHNHVIWNAL